MENQSIMTKILHIIIVKAFGRHMILAKLIKTFILQMVK